MNLLLLSLGVGAVPDFVAAHVNKPPGEVRLGYLNDATLPHAGEEFVIAERDQLQQLGYAISDITASSSVTADEFRSVLNEIDALYVAGGNTFTLLAALRRNGSDTVIVNMVHEGLPYIGSSAGSIITGSSIEPLALMDDPAEAPDLIERAGLGLLDTVIVPHADGALPPYPPELIAQIKQNYGSEYSLTFINDDQALLVSGTVHQLVSSP